MKLPSKFKKWRNRQYNGMLAKKFWLRWNLFGFPSIENGYKKIEKLGYKRKELIPFTSFTPLPVDPEHNWNVIRHDMDSAFCNRNCMLYHDWASFKTEAKTTYGMGLRYEGSPTQEWLKRPTRTGKADLQIELENIYSIEMQFDPKALDDWTAWWIYMANNEDETGYWEIDMMEHFAGDDINHLTTTMHFSFGEKNDGMMHNMKYRIKKGARIHEAVRFCDDGKIKLYLNGCLIWVNYLFPAYYYKDRKILMLINAGLGRYTYGGQTKIDLDDESYNFIVANLYKHTKPLRTALA
jgi:hypothetical protein